MKVSLFPFQQKAVDELRMNTAEALGGYYRTHTPQIVSFTAPTGAGKTIIMSALIEDIMFGTEQYTEQPEAIILWISDSPELNEQSKQKIDLKSDRITLQQTHTIEESSFDSEMFQDGQIYFLNTQKLSSSSRLTKHGDSRQFTIWETLQNTIREKCDRFYVIIDEAHRGMQGRKASEATTIMQKFIKGSQTDNLSPMPVVIGMSATIQRFNTLVGNTTATLHKVNVEADDVRKSGLLKDRIIVNYPEDGSSTNEMAILQAASDDWLDKVQHWHQYCYEQHYAHVNPVFVVQVENSTHDTRYSDTDLAECIRIITQRTNFHFKEGEVVHTFGNTANTIDVNGLNIQYREPSSIADDRNIKVVFFKENLSTGWDCPRAETMMSFRRAADYTNIAQLLGRMVRTPMQMHIMVDESLNDVHLFLPQFDRDNVEKVIKELGSAEGAKIPVDIMAETVGNESSQRLSIRPTITRPVQMHSNSSTQPTSDSNLIDNTFFQPQVATGDNATSTNRLDDEPIASSESIAPTQAYEVVEVIGDGIDRDAVMRYINECGMLTYEVRKVRIAKNYLSSLFQLCRLLVQTELSIGIKSKIMGEITNMIHTHSEFLRSSGQYDELCHKVMEFKLESKTYDIYGKEITENPYGPLFSSTDTDIDRQLRLAESKLCNEGISNLYGQRFFKADNPNEYKIDVILFVANQDRMSELFDEYAENKFHELVDRYRCEIPSLDDNFQRRYNNIVSDADEVSEHNFRLPENINVNIERNGKKYKKHLYVDSRCEATFNLNNWERELLKIEMQRPDFVCWLRNPSRKPWALCIPYQQNGEWKSMYPDFIVIRKKDNGGYFIDILEPHDQTRTDNVPKAIGLANYAGKNNVSGRVELIRMENGRFKRLDMARSQVRERVKQISTDAGLNDIYLQYSNN